MEMVMKTMSLTTKKIARVNGVLGNIFFVNEEISIIFLVTFDKIDKHN